MTVIHGFSLIKYTLSGTNSVFVFLFVYKNVFSLILFLFLYLYLRAVVHVQVGDVNEFSPVFSSAVYSGSVQEGRVCDSILQVDATDRDCSPQYSQICNYQIVTENAPFAIDRNG